jgi:hypothetical protein
MLNKYLTVLLYNNIYFNKPKNYNSKCTFKMLKDEFEESLTKFCCIFEECKIISIHW